ncbi:MAG: sugar phosphate isomerase/epimerase, partial [Planctomycetes bacterium]|nr:sugar phosphate isomerase/epimerase [Planctomycetota bacterium]
MTRPVTLFTGQWADLPFDTMCEKAKQFGYDGIELACWGDHFEVGKALSEDGYCAE